VRRTIVFIICFCIASTLAWGDERHSDFRKYWSQWRGPLFTGVAPYGDPPVEWSESQNVRWKIEIPGKGHASPIVWGEKIFVLTAVETDKPVSPQEAQKSEEQLPGWRRNSGKSASKINRFDILAINRQDGRILWQRTAHEEFPHAGTHAEGSWASNSPVTDGENIYAYFGSYGLYCYDMQGNLIWEKDLGNMKTKLSFGEGSSPALHGNTIIVNWDHEDQSFIVALNKRTGEEIWKVDRDEKTSWATPLIIEHNGRFQIITNATRRIRSYDLVSGELIWECGGMTGNVVPSPMVDDGIVYLTSGFRGNALLAIDLDLASGDITDSEAIVWSHDKNTPYAPSPLLYGDKLYLLQENKGFLSCLNTKTGEVYYTRQKLEDVRVTFVSLVGASDHVYIAGKDGVTFVLQHGHAFEVLAKNLLDDEFTASPAIVDKEIYLRGYKYLYCIAQD